MKKIFALILALCMALSLCACATVNEDGSPTPAGVAIEQGIALVARVLEAALAGAGTWVLSKIGKKKELQNTSIALESLFTITRQTVGELQQVLVKGWKDACGGKLTEEQIETLRKELFVLVKKKLDQPTQDLIIAAGCDIDALITGAAEDWINTIKTPLGLVYAPIGVNELTVDTPTYTTGPGIEDAEA